MAVFSSPYGNQEGPALRSVPLCSAAEPDKRLRAWLKSALRSGASLVRAVAGAGSVNGLDDRMLRDVGLRRDRHGELHALDGSDWL